MIIVKLAAVKGWSNQREQISDAYTSKVILSNGKLVSSLYRIQVFYFKPSARWISPWDGERGAEAHEVGAHPPHGFVT